MGSQQSTQRHSSTADPGHNLAFARHETFHPRYGWLKKGYDKAVERPDVFLREDAPVVLGVGKNMVRSIRYWCNAFKILKETRSRMLSGHTAMPTVLGRSIFSAGGWDPYSESLSSLWWLHWKLLEHPCFATSWYFAFNHFHKLEFTSETLFAALREFVNIEYAGNRTVDASLRKDVSCILRMYGGNSNVSADDLIGCPFEELGIIRISEDSIRSSFFVGQKPGLVSEIIVAACLEHSHKTSPSARTISISSLLFDVGSPGVVFKIDESTLCSAIEAVAQGLEVLHLGETAGILQFSFSDAPLDLSHKCLELAFGKGH